MLKNRLFNLLLSLVSFINPSEFNEVTLGLTIVIGVGVCAIMLYYSFMPNSQHRENLKTFPEEMLEDVEEIVQEVQKSELPQNSTINIDWFQSIMDHLNFFYEYFWFDLAIYFWSVCTILFSTWYVLFMKSINPDFITNEKERKALIIFMISNILFYAEMLFNSFGIFG